MPLSAEYLRSHPFADPGNVAVSIGTSYQYLAAVDGLSVTTHPSGSNFLSALPTTSIGDRVDVYLSDANGNSVLMSFFVVAGTADSTDPWGEVAAEDSDLTGNFWKKGL